MSTDADSENDERGIVEEFVAEDLWLLIAIVTFAVAGVFALVDLAIVSTVVATIGWFLLTPIFLFWGEEIASVLFGDRTGKGGRADALEELKRRYAAGEIDDEEFDRRLDRLLAVDDLPADVLESLSARDVDEATTIREGAWASGSGTADDVERDVERDPIRDDLSDERSDRRTEDEYERER